MHTYACPSPSPTMGPRSPGDLEANIRILSEDNVCFTFCFHGNIDGTLQSTFWDSVGFRNLCLVDGVLFFLTPN